MCPILELILTLNECLFCYIYCAQLYAHLRAIVIASCAVSNRESLYPRVGSEIGKIPLIPQRPSPACSTKKRRRVKYVLHFVDFNFIIFHHGPRDMIELNFLISHQGPRDIIDSNFLVVYQGPQDTKDQKI